MQRIYTERAHLMCPNMCFGIVITIDAVFDSEKTITAIALLEVLK